MSGQELLSTAPKDAKTNFAIPPQENPIKFGAQAIRDLTKQLVNGQLKGAFPRNYEYGNGDYNVIFVSMASYGNQGGGFSTSNDMLILTPEGNYLSGNVEHRVSDWSNDWDIEAEKLKVASDLEILKYSSKVIKALFYKLRSELSEQTEFKNAKKVLGVLSRKKEVLEKVSAISKISLIEMGQTFEELESTENGTEEDSILLKKAKESLTIYQERRRLILAIEAVSELGRAAGVESKILELFPKGENPTINWNKIINPIAGQKLSESSHGIQIWHGERAWLLEIKDGKINEKYGHYGLQQPDRRCAEHIIESGTRLATGIIATTVAESFPNLIWGS